MFVYLAVKMKAEPEEENKAHKYIQFERANWRFPLKTNETWSI
jgi:hypothetical protein